MTPRRAERASREPAWFGGGDAAAPFAELVPPRPPQTLFVGRLSRETTEDKLRREFEQFGPIKVLRIVEDSEVCRAPALRAPRHANTRPPPVTHTHTHTPEDRQTQERAP